MRTLNKPNLSLYKKYSFYIALFLSVIFLSDVLSSLKPFPGKTITSTRYYYHHPLFSYLVLFLSVSYIWYYLKPYSSYGNKIHNLLSMTGVLRQCKTKIKKRNRAIRLGEIIIPKNIEVSKKNLCIRHQNLSASNVDESSRFKIALKKESSINHIVSYTHTEGGDNRFLSSVYLLYLSNSNWIQLTTQSTAVQLVIEKINRTNSITEISEKNLTLIYMLVSDLETLLQEQLSLDPTYLNDLNGLYSNSTFISTSKKIGAILNEIH